MIDKIFDVAKNVLRNAIDALLGGSTSPSEDSLLGMIDDIKSVDSIPFFPLAPFWMILTGLIVCAVLVYIIIKIWRKLREKKWQNRVINELEALAENAANEPQKKIITRLSEILRRVAIRQYGRAACAGLEGEAWLKWLTENDPEKFDWTKEGWLITNFAYAPPDDVTDFEKIRILSEAVIKWVRRSK